VYHTVEKVVKMKCGCGGWRG